MQIKKATLLSCLAILLTGALHSDAMAQEAQSRDTGISAAELRDLADLVPPGTGTIQAIQFLRKDGFSIDRAAILMAAKSSGWQIFLFHFQDNGKFSLEWKSGKLDDSFAVSSATQFQPYTSFGEQTFTFSGCAAHNCPDVFSVMFYVPSKNMALTATYTLGKVTYSPPVVAGSRYQIYRSYLDRLIAEHRSIAN